jgi:hypothetical protein
MEAQKQEPKYFNFIFMRMIVKISFLTCVYIYMKV